LGHISKWCRSKKGKRFFFEKTKDFGCYRAVAAALVIK